MPENVSPATPTPTALKCLPSCCLDKGHTGPCASQAMKDAAWEAEEPSPWIDPRTLKEGEWFQYYTPRDQRFSEPLRHCGAGVLSDSIHTGFTDGAIRAVVYGKNDPAILFKRCEAPKAPELPPLVPVDPCPFQPCSLVLGHDGLCSPPHEGPYIMPDGSLSHDSQGSIGITGTNGPDDSSLGTYGGPPANLVESQRKLTEALQTLNTYAEKSNMPKAELPPLTCFNKRNPMPDPVNHPSHYTSHPSGVECIQVTRHMNFNCGNAVKYLWRAGLKDSAPSVQDLKKAAWYLADEIKRQEALK